MTSKTGELMGNSIVPIPTSMLPQSNQTNESSDTPDQNVAAKSTALKKMQKIKEQIAEVNGEITLTVRNRPDIIRSSEQERVAWKDKVDALYDKRAKLTAEQTEASQEFNSAVSTQNQPPPSQEKTSNGWTVSSSNKSIFADDDSRVVNLSAEDFDRKYGKK
jgi:hypothetical protein